MFVVAAAVFLGDNRLGLLVRALSGSIIYCAMEASVRASATNCPEPRYFTIVDLSAAESVSLLAGIDPETTANTIASNATIPNIAKTAVSASHAAVPGHRRLFALRSIEGFARIGCFL